MSRTLSADLTTRRRRSSIGDKGKISIAMRAERRYAVTGRNTLRKIAATQIIEKQRKSGKYGKIIGKQLMAEYRSDMRKCCIVAIGEITMRNKKKKMVAFHRPDAEKVRYNTDEREYLEIEEAIAGVEDFRRVTADQEDSELEMKGEKVQIVDPEEGTEDMEIEELVEPTQDMQVEHGARTEIMSDADASEVDAAEDSDSPSVKTGANSVDASKQVGGPGGVGRRKSTKKGSLARGVG